MSIIELTSVGSRDSTVLIVELSSDSISVIHGFIRFIIPRGPAVPGSYLPFAWIIIWKSINQYKYIAYLIKKSSSSVTKMTRIHPLYSKAFFFCLFTRVYNDQIAYTVQHNKYPIFGSRAHDHCHTFDWHCFIARLQESVLSSISIATNGHRQSLSDKRNMCTCDSIIEKNDIRFSTTAFLMLIKRRVGDAESLHNSHALESLTHLAQFITRNKYFNITRAVRDSSDSSRPYCASALNFKS